MNAALVFLALATSSAVSPVLAEWQPLYVARTAESGNLVEGRYRVLTVRPDGKESPAAIRRPESRAVASSSAAGLTLSPGLWEVDVPDGTARVHLIPMDGKADAVASAEIWRPAEDADGSLWFELPRRVVSGAAPGGVGKPIELSWADENRPFATLRPDPSGMFGLNLPVGDGTWRDRGRDVRWHLGGGFRPDETATGHSAQNGTVTTHPGKGSQITVTAFFDPGVIPTPGVAPCVGVYPNPWRSKIAINEYLVFFGLKPGDGVDIYTITGEKVRTLGGPYEPYVIIPYAADPEFISAADPDLRNFGYLFWDGRNTRGKEVADGVYLFVINLGKHDCDGKVAVKGRLTIIR